MADPTIEEDLDELEAYFKKGPAVSRAACGRMVTTFRLLQGRFRRQLDESRDETRSLRWEIAYLCDRVLELRAYDADEDHAITTAANARLREERVEIDQLNGRLLALLDATVIALKGPHPARGLHDLSDVPARAAEAMDHLVKLTTDNGDLLAIIARLRSDQRVDLDLVGISEIARMRGFSRQRAREISKDRDFPEPLARLAMGPVWSRPDVIAFFDRRYPDGNDPSVVTSDA